MSNGSGVFEGPVRGKRMVAHGVSRGIAPSCQDGLKPRRGRQNGTGRWIGSNDVPPLTGLLGVSGAFGSHGLRRGLLSCRRSAASLMPTSQTGESLRADLRPRRAPLAVANRSSPTAHAVGCRCLAPAGLLRAKALDRPVACAFTLIELLVVIAIITVLLGAIFAASTTIIDRSRSNATQTVLSVVRDACEQFKREQKSNPTLTRRDAYHKRYGEYPPDELEVFANPSPYYPTLPGWPEAGFAGGNATIIPPEFPGMKFYTKTLTPAEQAVEHRDLAAMILAIELFGQESKSILDQIPERNRSAGALNDRSPPQPSQFLDRNGNDSWDAADDLQIRYILDDWGNPISYLAQRDFKEDTEGVTRSSNHDAWNEASTELIRLNGGQPVIFSYGPNGKDQLTAESMGASGGGPGPLVAPTSLVGDFEGEAPAGHEHKIDHPLNADNLYADPAFKEKIAKGLQ